MTAGAPWSVKGIDPKAREVAKDLARRSGMTLGEWLNRMILEDESPEDVFSESQLPPRASRPYYETAREPEAPARFETPLHPNDEIGRIIRSLDRLAERAEETEQHTGHAIGGVEHSVREALARIEATERDHVAVAARFEGAVAEVADTQARLAERIRQIEAEAAGPRSAEALRSLERALGKVATHLYDGEDRTRALIEAVESRVGRLENEDVAAPIDPAKLIDAVVERISERLAEAEARTGDALEALRQSFAALDSRVNAVESGDGAQKFEQLAASLTARVEASRVDIAAQLRTGGDARLDRIEQTLSDVARQVRDAEQGSAHAIERMGRDLASMTQSLTQRVATVESHSADAIERVGGEMARIAQAMEGRFNQADVVHAQALEKLGGEISRITERLSERIGAAERRSAQAVDEVAEQVARSAERANQRQERASEDLAERIRQSEERTARLLTEARAKIEEGLAESRMRVAAAPAAPAAERAFATLPPAEPDPFAQDARPDAFAAYAAFAAPATVPTVAAAAAGSPVTFEAFASDAPFPDPDEEAPAPEFGAEDLEAAEAFAAIAEPDADDFAEALIGADAEENAPEADTLPEVAALISELDAAAASKAPADAEGAGQIDEADQTDEAERVRAEALDFDDSFIIEEPAPVPELAPYPSFKSDAFPESSSESPRIDPLDRLEALDRDADRDPFAINAPAEPLLNVEPPEAARPLTTREVVDQARAAARAAAQNGDPKRAKTKIEKLEGEGGGGLFSSFGMRPKRRAGSKLQIALMLTGGAAALGVATAGFVLDGKPAGEAPPRVADSIALNAEPGPTQPRAAVALTPSAITEPAGEGAVDPSQDLPALYAEAQRAVESGEAGAADKLKKVANLGYARAQFHLAKLYENGDAGLPKDAAETRRWTERAARGGDREAMHNFALQQFFGDGGPKNPAGASEWFRKAADLGLVDSQYNLARLYEDGVGVARNHAEAYKWYLIAARSGDPDSKESARRVRAKLSPDAQNVSERAALSFRPAILAAAPGLAAAGDAAPAASGEAATAVATAQRALSRLGYYQGPSDGASSPALKLALAAYQRDQGLEPTGALDETTVSRLSIFTR